MKLKSLFRVFLVIVVLFFCVLILRSIMRPERFKQVYELRKTEIVTRLSAIRTIQVIYKNENKKYAADVDELAKFVENGYIQVTKIVGEIPEDMSEEDAFKKGLLKKEIMKIPAKDKIMEADPKIVLDNFQYIPYTDKQKFQIDTASISTATYSIPVYRIDVSRDEVLANMERSLMPENGNVFNKLMNKILYTGLADENQYRLQYEGIWMGSLTEASTTGSWE